MKQDWEIKTLKDIGSIFSGNSINAKVKKEKYLNYPEGFPYVATKDVGYDSSIDYDNGVKIPYFEKELFRIAPKNSVLICAEGGSAGRKMGRINQDICFVNKLFAITPKNETTSKYLFYWYNTDEFQREFKSRLTGLIGGVSKRKFETIPIPIPPLDEQKRIVAKLDKCFEAIDKARANVGKNLNNAKELFQSQLNQIFSQKGDGWVDKKLGEITTKIGSGATPRGGKASYKETGISLIRSLNVYDNGFRKKNLAFIDNEQASKLDNVKVEKDDVLLNITGASVARCCIVPKEYLPARVNQHVSIIRLHSEAMKSRFLHYSLISNDNKDLLLGIGEQGATRQAITKAQIENFYISYPANISEQLNMVNQLDDLKSQTQTLESNYQQELNALDELKKSILQKAFNGEL